MNLLGIILIHGCFGAVVHGAVVQDCIVGGGEGPARMYNYQVSFRNAYHRHFLWCSGSILNKYWILTAAHCLTGRTSKDVDFVIMTNTNYLDDVGDTYRPDHIVVHEYYGEYGGYDIAMIRVVEEIIFNDLAQPIELPEKDLSDVGTRAMFAGWGRVKDARVASPRLMEFELNILTAKDCENKYKFLIRNHICASNTLGEGICVVDSGGPLVANGVQVAIALNMSSCGGVYPDFFTKIFPHTDWIRDTMEKYDKCFGQKNDRY